MSKTEQLEKFGDKVGHFVCKDGKTTFIPITETKKPEEPFIFGKIQSSNIDTTNVRIEEIKQIVDSSIKKYFNKQEQELEQIIDTSIEHYFIKQEQELEQPRKELYELSLQLNTLGYNDVFKKVSYYLQIRGNNIKSIQNLKKEMTDAIKDKENMIQEYKQLSYELKSKYNIDYVDNPLKNIAKDFYYEKNAIQILKQKLEENKTSYFHSPFFGQK
jgi:hypothetical protein